MKRKAVLVVAAAALLAACGDGDASGVDGCTPGSGLVCMGDDFFDPATLTVASGASVRWRNGGERDHTVTSNPANPAGCPTFDTTARPGQTTSGVTFSAAAGTQCQYYCKLHATPTSGVMRGTIVVQ